MPKDDTANERDTARAWLDYLRTTKRLKGIDYEQVEPFAWRKLDCELVRIRAREAVTTGA